MTAKTLYHVTPRRNLPSILASGLRTRRGPRSRRAGETVDAVFAFPSRSTAEEAHWLIDALDGCGALALIEIRPDRIWPMRADTPFEIAILQHIPPDRLTVASTDF